MELRPPPSTSSAKASHDGLARLLLAVNLLLLLAVDRPLDMLRTVVNVWSDSCGAALIARSEGESGPAELVRAGAG